MYEHFVYVKEITYLPSSSISIKNSHANARLPGKELEGKSSSGMYLRTHKYLEEN